MKQVFLDTVGLIALLDEADQWHDAAEAAYSGLLREPAEPITTSYVLLECGNAASRRPYRDHVVTILNEMEGQGRVVFPSESDWRVAWRSYQGFSAGGPSIVDCVSFEIMRRLGVREAFTNDQHFTAAGFQVLF